MCWCTYFSRLKCNHAPCSGKKQQTSNLFSLLIINLLVRCMCMWWGNPQDHFWLNISASMNTILFFFPVFPFFLWKGRFSPLFSSRIFVFAKGWCKRGVKCQDSCLKNQLNSWLPKYCREQNWKHPCEDLRTSLKSSKQQKCQFSAERLRFLQHFFWLWWTKTSFRFRITTLRLLA